VGRPFAGTLTRAETSYEFVQKFIYKLAELDEGSRFKKLFASLKNNAVILADLYDSALFIDVHVQQRDSRIAWQTWTYLRWRLLLAKILLIQANRIQKANRLKLQEE
jgi:hypothetical protein